MASRAKIATNEKKKALVAKYAAQRAELKATLASPAASEDAKAAARRTLEALPRNSSATRVRNRCVLTGRSRAYYRKFGVSRLMLRQHGLRGDIPGLTKSSW